MAFSHKPSLNRQRPPEDRLRARIIALSAQKLSEGPKGFCDGQVLLAEEAPAQGQGFPDPAFGLARLASRDFELREVLETVGDLKILVAEKPPPDPVGGLDRALGRIEQPELAVDAADGIQ